jgi:flagellar assembly protein FliH
VLESARQEAAAMLEQARQEADRVRIAACREGYSEGQTRGFEEWAEQREQLRAQFGKIGDAYRAFCEAQVPDLVSLVMAAAEIVLQEQLTLEPERIVTIVRRALNQVLAATRVVIHLHPDDLQIVRSRMPVLELPQSPTYEFQPDPQVERGGCWIETDHGEVDATLAGALSRLRETVASS